MDTTQSLDSSNKPQMDDAARLLFLIKDTGLNNSMFAERTGLACATFSHIAKGRQKPTLQIFRSVLQAFPEYSRDWLYDGIGEMKIQRQEPSSSFSINPEEAYLSPNDKESLSSNQSLGGKSSEFKGDLFGTIYSSNQDPNKANHQSVQNQNPLYASAQNKANKDNAQPISSNAQSLDQGARHAYQAGASSMPFDLQLVKDAVKDAFAQADDLRPRQRKITEIRIFFDDGTYESFMQNIK